MTSIHHPPFSSPAMKMMTTGRIQKIIIAFLVASIGRALQLPQQQFPVRTASYSDTNSSHSRPLQIQRHHWRGIYLWANKEGKDDILPLINNSDSNGLENTTLKPQNEQQSTSLDEVTEQNRNTVKDLLGQAAKPTTLFQKAITKYWEEFEKDPFEFSSMQQSTTTSSRTSLPSVAALLQLLQLLSEFYNDPNVDGKLTVLEAWRESKTYKNETAEDLARDTCSDDVTVTTQTTIDAVNRTKWVDSWNEGLTNEDLRDAGDHIWRYLIGDWSKVRRNKVLLFLIRAVCIAVLTWGFLESLLTSLTVSGVWTWTAMTQPSSWASILWHPVAQHREILLNSYNAFRLHLDPVFFALKALGTLVLVPYYENMVCTVERVCFNRDYRARYPLISRLQGLLISFAFGFVGVRLLTITGIFAGALLTLCKQWVMSIVRPNGV